VRQVGGDDNLAPASTRLATACSHPSRFSGRPCLYAVFRLEAALPFRQLGLQPPSGSVLGAKFPDQYLVSLDLQSASCASLSHPISIGPYFTAVLGFRHVHPFLTDPAQLFAFYRSPTPLRKRSAA
jgi:hypothetical protein